MIATLWTPRRDAFAVRFLAGFSFVLLAVAAIAFMLPIEYCSTARIEVDAPDANPGNHDPDFSVIQMEVLRSKAVLGPVIEKKYGHETLNDIWSGESKMAGILRTQETYEILLSRLTIRKSPNSSLIEVRIDDKDPRLAAALVNEIVRVYSEAVALPKGIRVQIVDPAVPALRPVRPNVPFIIALGILLGILVGSSFAYLANRLSQRGTPSSSVLSVGT